MKFIQLKSRGLCCSAKFKERRPPGGRQSRDTPPGGRRNSPGLCLTQKPGEDTGGRALNCLSGLTCRLYQEGRYVFGFEAGEGAELFDGYEGAFFLLKLFANAGQELAGRSLPPSRYVHDVFGVDDNTVWYRIHSSQIWYCEI
jgi:hypothetical protein